MNRTIIPPQEVLLVSLVPDNVENEIAFQKNHSKIILFPIEFKNRKDKKHENITKVYFWQIAFHLDFKFLEKN